MATTPQRAPETSNAPKDLRLTGLPQRSRNHGYKLAGPWIFGSLLAMAVVAGSLAGLTLSLLLWLAAVMATIVLYKNCARKGVDADAVNVVAMVVVAGVIGAKAWHELQNVSELEYALRMIGAPGCCSA